MGLVVRKQPDAELARQIRLLENLTAVSEASMNIATLPSANIF